MKKAVALLLFLCLLCPLATGFATGESEYTKYSKSFFGTFDTLVVIMGYARAQETFDEVFMQAKGLFERYHQIYDNYNAYPGMKNMYLLNQQAPAGEPVEVERELMDLLLFCKENQPLTRGTVNVALGSVLSIWHDYRELAENDPAAARVPPMDKLQAAAAHTDFDSILLDAQACTVTFTDPAVRLDIGAVAKGYATEQVAQWMLQSGMPSFLISAGGNVRAGQPPMDGRLRWGVSIQDPDGQVLTGAEEDILDVLFLHNASVVTSGDYQRFFVADGVRYHHIISPETLMPADYYRSVTIVCEDSGMADLLSTAVFLMPYEESRAFVESLDGVEAYWMLQDGTLALTDGMVAMSRANGAKSK